MRIYRKHLILFIGDVSQLVLLNNRGAELAVVVPELLEIGMREEPIEAKACLDLGEPESVVAIEEEGGEQGDCEVQGHGGQGGHVQHVPRVVAPGLVALQVEFVHPLQLGEVVYQQLQVFGVDMALLAQV